MDAADTTDDKGLRFSITVSPDLRIAIDRASKAEGRSHSNWIARALAKLLKVKKGS